MGELSMNYGCIVGGLPKVGHPCTYAGENTLTRLYVISLHLYIYISNM